MELKKIATFHSPFSTKFGIPRQAGLVEDLCGTIVFEPEYRSKDAVRGLEGFDYLWIIWEFSANKHEGGKALVRPPRLGGNKSVGVFASRSPFRPNPIGLSSVKIEEIIYGDEKSRGCVNTSSSTSSSVIHDAPSCLVVPDSSSCSVIPDSSLCPIIKVKGADLMDGTPIYDIKPYIPYTDCHEGVRGGYTDEVEWKPLKVTGTDDEVLKAVLAQDPRPHYHNDPNRIYGMEYNGKDIHFRINNDIVEVLS